MGISRHFEIMGSFNNSLIIGLQIRDKVKGDSLYFHKPKLRKAFIAKHKHFTCSLWMKKGEWLATATGAGTLLLLVMNN
jgi:hypothetical protein